MIFCLISAHIGVTQIWSLDLLIRTNQVPFNTGYLIGRLIFYKQSSVGILKSKLKELNLPKYVQLWCPGLCHQSHFFVLLFYFCNLVPVFAGMIGLLMPDDQPLSQLVLATHKNQTTRSRKLGKTSLHRWARRCFEKCKYLSYIGVDNCFGGGEKMLARNRFKRKGLCED